MILLRYADVLLTYAEAKNENTGPDQNIFDALNLFRARAKMPSIPSTLNQAESIAEIRLERRVELAGEGLYYYDIRRWKIADQLLNGNITNSVGARIDSRLFDANKDYFWPIPSIAIQNNPSLKKNPNYNK